MPKLQTLLTNGQVCYFCGTLNHSTEYEFKYFLYLLSAEGFHWTFYQHSRFCANWFVICHLLSLTSEIRTEAVGDDVNCTGCASRVYVYTWRPDRVHKVCKNLATWGIVAPACIENKESNVIIIFWWSKNLAKNKRVSFTPANLECTKISHW